MNLADLLLRAKQFIEGEQPSLAAAVLGEALNTARQGEKLRVIQMLEHMAIHNDTAACNLGLALMRGDGVDPDPRRGADLLEQVLDRGDPDHAAYAHNLLGEFYRGAFNTPVDVQKAVLHYEVSGRHGNRVAAFTAGLMLETKTHGLSRDVTRAAVNYRRAVNGGYPRAMTKLAVLIITESVTSLDPDEAVALLLKASRMGDKEAELVLAILEDYNGPIITHD